MLSNAAYMISAVLTIALLYYILVMASIYCEILLKNKQATRQPYGARKDKIMYIYTVKPLIEAIKIAVEHDHLEVADSGEVRIYGIFLKNWPAGVQIKSKERITGHSIQTVGEFRFTIPLQYFTETEEKPVPEFIMGLYEAMTENCLDVNCEDCPLHLINKHTDYTCSELISWTKKRWLLNDTRRI